MKIHNMLTAAVLFFCVAAGGCSNDFSLGIKDAEFSNIEVKIKNDTECAVMVRMNGNDTPIYTVEPGLTLRKNYFTNVDVCYEAATVFNSPCGMRSWQGCCSYDKNIVLNAD